MWLYLLKTVTTFKVGKNIETYWYHPLNKTSVGGELQSYITGMWSVQVPSFETHSILFPVVERHHRNIFIEVPPIFPF